jgi:hypothetical protein
MTRLLAAAGMLLLLAAARSYAAPSGVIVISDDRTSVSTRLGQSFSFHSTVTNRGPTAAAGLIAHLNVLSVRRGVYVDPEDWSSQRTRYLPMIPPGGKAVVTWRIKVVDSGSIGIYVAVLRAGAHDPPVTGPTLTMAIADRRSLDAGGILPLALGMPALLLLLLLGVRLARRR